MRTLAQQFCGVREASALLGLSEASVKHMADAGRVRMVRDPVGRRLLNRADVERLAKERRKQYQPT